ncbi:PucR family transcriptional regulator [Streptomyces sp. NPDC057565]|uniref:PucR family transcriptional regulator n=1 Tax=Streptomyces sp. NPDC057565 TaxID=3346169 RepID=UPI00367473B3
MITLQGLLDAVGASVLSEVSAPGRAPVALGEVVIAEPDSELELGRGDVILGVNLVDREAALGLLSLCARQSAAALLLKAPAAVDAEVTTAATAAGVALIQVAHQAGWAQVVSLLRAALDSDRLAESVAGLGVAEAADLFDLADAIANIIDAPVTIEDRSSRVLAYSTRQERDDEARVATIMGRHVPDEVNAHYRRHGVFRKIAQNKRPIYVPAVVEGTKPRLVVPVHAGGDVLGSIWAIVPGPVPAERAVAFAAAADAAALHLLRRRAEADRERLVLTDMVARVLHGKAGAVDAARLLGLSAGPWRVIAVGVRCDGADEAETQRLAVQERLSRFPGSRLRSPAAVIGSVVYGIVDAEPVAPASRRHSEWLYELGETAGRATQLVAVGGLAASVPELAASREQADDTLGLLMSGLITDSQAVHDDVWAKVVHRRVALAASTARTADIGPLRHLVNHDRECRTSYVPTLEAWLEEMGDPKAAAARLHIHPNTLRHRMRRLRDVVELQLDSPDVRSALLLQLTALRYGAESGAPTKEDHQA